MLLNLARWVLFDIVLCFTLPQVRASKYGENHAPVEKDEHIIAAHFPHTDHVLLSPAFLNPSGVLPGFSNGTDGPTDDATLGA